MSRSARPLAAWLLLVAPASLALGACVAPEPPHGKESGEAFRPPTAELAIDGGAELALEPGEGIAVGVEYSGEGRWSVTTSCDTALTGLSCTFDLVVSTDELSPITDYGGDMLEGDRLVSLDRFALSGTFETDDDLDAFGFTTSPGATVRVSALLYDLEGGGWDWLEDPRIISWIGNGGVHRGAPTNPVDLTPASP